MRLLGLLAVVGSLAMVVVLFAVGLGDGPYSMNGEPISKAEFVRFLLPFSLIYFGACLFAGLAARSIRNEAPAARSQLMVFLLFPALSAFVVPKGGEVPPALVEGILPWLIVPAIGWIYLYRQRGVVAYYDALADEAAERAQPPL